MKKSADWLNLLANIAIVCAAVCLIYFIFQSKHSKSANDLKIGQRISGLAIQPSDQDPTVVVALQTGCPFCEAGMPFYRELEQSTGDNRTHLLFVLPQTLKIDKEYLAKNGISNANVEQKNLATLGINATPTLMILNSAGVLENYWVGELDSNRQAEVKKVLAHP